MKSRALGIWVVFVAALAAGCKKEGGAPLSVVLEAPTGTLRGSVTLTATMTGGSAPLTGAFKSGAATLCTVSTAPYQCVVDTATLPDGPATFTVDAVDKGGATATATVMRTIDNTPPSIAITAPQMAAVVSGVVALTATATDATSAITTVEFRLDGLTLVTGTASGSTYSASWDTTSLSGAHTLTAVATDGAGNTTTSPMVAVTIDAGSAPGVVSVGSPTADGTYGAGAAIAIEVTFSQPVVVTGTPTLRLETGATDRDATYTSGSGTSTLTFHIRSRPAITRPIWTTRRPTRWGSRAARSCRRRAAPRR